MASEIDIFSIYKSVNDAQYFVLKTIRPEFNNASQSQEDESWETESVNRLQLLESLKKHENDEFERIGEFHGYPIGDIFYSEFAQLHIPVYYMQTDFGKPWIVLGTADSEAEFLAKLKDDEDFQALKPIGKPTKIGAYFITQNNS